MGTNAPRVKGKCQAAGKPKERIERLADGQGTARGGVTGELMLRHYTDITDGLATDQPGSPRPREGGQPGAVGGGGGEGGGGGDVVWCVGVRRGFLMGYQQHSWPPRDPRYLLWRSVKWMKKVMMSNTFYQKKKNKKSLLPWLSPSHSREVKLSFDPKKNVKR